MSAKTLYDKLWDSHVVRENNDGTSLLYIEDVKLLCQIIIDKISQPMYLGKHQCNVGISIGVSLYPDHGTDYNTLMRVADSSMYQVKRQGKNDFLIGE